MNHRLIAIAALIFAALEANGLERTVVIEQINQERERQDQQWGGPGHDLSHSAEDWILLLVKHVGKLAAEAL